MIKFLGLILYDWLQFFARGCSGRLYPGLQKNFTPKSRENNRKFHLLEMSSFWWVRRCYVPNMNHIQSRDIFPVVERNLKLH